MTFFGEIEFDCVECGRHIIVVCGEMPDPKLCAACLALPGWPRDPELARILDPDFEVRDRLSSIELSNKG